MAAFTIDDLITPLETEELKASIYQALATVGVTTTTWKPGAVVRTIIAVVAIILHALSVLISNIARMGFLELASGVWLALKALYDFNEPKQYATFAAGTVYVSNSSGGVYVLDPDDLEVASSITSKSYRNTVAVTINAGASFVPVAVRAVESGSASSALVGEIDRVVTALNGLSVTNTAVLVGFDDESDETLKNRCKDKLGALSPNGPGDAYSYLAKTAVRADGSLIGVNRVRAKPDGMGGLDVYVATATGPLTGPDLALVEERLQTQCAPLGITVRVANATPVLVPIVYTAYAYDTTGLTEQSIKDAISGSLLAYFASTEIGGNVIPGADGFVYQDDIRAEISRSKYKGTSTRVFRTLLSTPAADVMLAAFEYPTLDTITAAVVRVSPNLGAS